MKQARFHFVATESFNSSMSDKLKSNQSILSSTLETFTDAHKVTSRRLLFSDPEMSIWI